jgi:hypothetical protein
MKRNPAVGFGSVGIKPEHGVLIRWLNLRKLLIMKGGISLGLMHIL